MLSIKAMANQSSRYFFLLLHHYAIASPRQTLIFRIDCPRAT